LDWRRIETFGGRRVETSGGGVFAPTNARMRARMRAIKIIAAVAAVVGAETRVVTATGSPFAYFEARAPPTPTGGARVGAFGMVAVPKCFPACAWKDSVERPKVRADAWRVRDEILVERFEAAAGAAREAAGAAREGWDESGASERAGA
jgi:hypothetical protein|tara:strand:- start:1780 stop:2226 length:447 start_codon:yes stop_codon:yes gene_type:complete